MKKSRWLSVWLFLGFGFLYIPLLTLVVYSFNRSQIVTLFGGWSLHWYLELLNNPVLLSAVKVSLQIGILASSLAVVLGVMLSVVLSRYGQFKGRSFLYGMTITPLVMPDVITGLSLLLMFVSTQSWFSFPQQGFLTILIAHVTVCTAYATIVLQARLTSLDRNFEEAAMDLGAKPVKTFFWITLPQIGSSIAVAWLLSFTLSIDDLIITTFVSGPSTVTLPMYVYSSIRNGMTPEINALATVLILLVTLIILLGAWIYKRLGE